MKKFVTYKIIYSGNVLYPAKYYIGSTSMANVNSGKYFGSITSKKWHNKFYNELKNNPQDFKLEILNIFFNRFDALTDELRLHKLYNVVISDEYFNESFATPNGFFGRDVSGENNPMFGKKCKETTKEKISKTKTGVKLSEEARRNISEGHKGLRHSPESYKRAGEKLRGIPLTEETKKKISEATKGRDAWNKGIKHSEETRRKMSKKAKENTSKKQKEVWSARMRKILTCPYCNKTGMLGGMLRWHFDKCKHKKIIL